MWTSIRERGTGLAAGLMVFCTQAAICGTASAGPYAGPAYPIGDMVAWADAVVSIQRGPEDIADPMSPLVTFGVAADALGVADNVVVSLGDAGEITVSLASPAGNGPGDDFAVYENGFLLEGADTLFAELAFVEVSSDGVNFARFDTVTLRVFDPDLENSGFLTIDPSNFENFAGDQPLFFGTGFDLAELAGHPLAGSGQLDLFDIRYVRLVDVIGDGSTQDSLMNPIQDPYPTPFWTGGFDLDAVGVINVPEPGLGTGLLAGVCGLWALARRRRAS